jgi:hypothetical protein
MFRYIWFSNSYGPKLGRGVESVCTGEFFYHSIFLRRRRKPNVYYHFYLAELKSTEYTCTGSLYSQDFLEASSIVGGKIAREAGSLKYLQRKSIDSKNNDEPLLSAVRVK